MFPSPPRTCSSLHLSPFFDPILQFAVGIITSSQRFCDKDTTSDPDRTKSTNFTEPILIPSQDHFIRGISCHPFHHHLRSGKRSRCVFLPHPSPLNLPLTNLCSTMRGNSHSFFLSANLQYMRRDDGAITVLVMTFLCHLSPLLTLSWQSSPNFTESQGLDERRTLEPLSSDVFDEFITVSTYL